MIINFKYIKVLYLGLGILQLMENFPAQAMEEGDTEGSEIFRQSVHEVTKETTTVNHVSGIRYFLEKLQKQDLKPHQILIVSDLDGTLTVDKYPVGIKSKKAVPYPKSTEEISSLIAEGYKVVVSSAGDNFPRTIESIKEIGLAGKLNVQKVKSKDGEAVSGGYITTKKFRELYGQGMPELHNQGEPYASNSSLKSQLSWHVNGNVVSVQKDKGSRRYKDNYFRDKGLAPLFVYNNQALRDVKAIIFVDDSAGNTTIFEKNVDEAQEYGHYPNLQFVGLAHLDRDQVVTRLSATINGKETDSPSKITVTIPGKEETHLSAIGTKNNARIELSDRLIVDKSNLDKPFLFNIQQASGKQQSGAIVLPSKFVDILNKRPEILSSLQLVFAYSPDNTVTCSVNFKWNQRTS